MGTVYIDGENLTLEDVEEVALRGARVELSPQVETRVNLCRGFVEGIVKREEVVYGITTGFGKLCQVRIEGNQIGKLQENLIKSHSAGVGRHLSIPETRGMMLLRANLLSKGHSGVRLELIQTLVEILNRGIHPLVPEKGSVGASGDLAPLAHIGLVMIGLGKAEYKRKILDGKVAMERAGIGLLTLEAKEGLALINGTQFMSSIGTLSLLKALRLCKVADIAGAMTLEGALATPTAFDQSFQQVRGYRGQKESADNLRRLVQESQIVEYHKDCGKVQDPYSIRCMPQVHGATREALRSVRSVLEVEINSATDNPLIFPQEGKVISGGNFHGQPVSIFLDLMGIAASALGNISERRIALLMNENESGLPPFLSLESGLHSGFMIAQVTAASLVSENKILAHPASVDSIPTSANQEDHVSMGGVAARKAREIIDNLEYILAIELLASAQAIDLRAPLKPGRGTGEAWRLIRAKVPKLNQDRILAEDIEIVKELIEEGEMVRGVEEKIGRLN